MRNVYNKEYNYKENQPFHVELANIVRNAPHYHDKSLEILFCLDGTVNFVAGIQSGTIHKGEIFSIDCEDIHYLYSDEPNVVLIFHLDLTNLPIPWEKLKYTFFACESTHCYPYQQEAMNTVKDAILALSYLCFCEESDLQNTDNLINNLVKTLYHFFNYYNYDNQDDYTNPELFDRFYAVLQYCFDNYQSKIILDDVASHSHISKNYISQYFGNTPFGSFSNMLQDVRCYKAERFLLTTKLPNTEIAYMCGFSDTKYLYSAFRSWFGCTPKEHRKKFKEYLKKKEELYYLGKQNSKDAIASAIVEWHLEKSQHCKTVKDDL